MTRAHSVHELVYRSARSFYLTLKKIFGPAVRSRPRVHRFAAAVREGIKKLIRTPETGYETCPANGPEREPALLHAPESRSKLPVWLIDEWRKIHAIEPQLFPDHTIQFNIVTDFIRPSKVGDNYLDLCAVYGENISHVFLVPWLKKGGADLVTINYVKALNSCGFGKKIVVISTEDSDSPWAGRLPGETRVIEFGKRYAHLSPEEQEKLLTRLFLQLAPRVIHNINSLLGYNTFIKYGKAIAATSRLYASAFCEDITPEGRSLGYPICFLPQCFDFLTAVLSDNQHILDKLRGVFAFDREKLFVHYQPVDGQSAKVLPEKSLNKNSLDIFWASRLDIQKRPDILIRIAESCKDLPFTFHVYGSPVYGTARQDAEAFVKSLNTLSNVRYYGPFDGLKSLPTERYDVFLYTSQWDGLPNVLLEAVSLGLPVVASDTGGIPELIRDGETGFIVTPFDNIDGYVDALKKIHQDQLVLQRTADNALELLGARHSRERFNEELKRVPFYVSHFREDVKSDKSRNIDNIA